MSFVGRNIDTALDRTRARTSTARAVLAQLARYANTELMAYPTQILIARRVGIKSRQVRNCLRELEALGEIEVVEKGGNRPTKYRVKILSDEVLERQPAATPKAEMERQSTTGPENRWSGNTVSLERQPIAAEVIEEEIPSLPASFSDGEDGIRAEKREAKRPASFSANSDTEIGAVAGLPGDRAREVRRIIPATCDVLRWRAS